MDQCILRAIQQEVRRIECKLDNPRTGLAEIKSEVAAIECAIKDLDLHDILCKLNALARELEEVEGAVDDVEDKLDNPHFGLEEIKEEIEGIERTLACLNLTPVLGLLNQIKHEVHEIECKLDNPHFGLEEIKEEVAAIECAVTNPETGLPEILDEVEEIEDLLKSPHFGLEEIKREVAAIECRLDNLNIQQLLALVAAVKGTALVIEHKLDNPHFGLEEIKREVEGIEETLCNQHFGLREIKDEIEDIVHCLHEQDLEHVLALLGAIEAEVMAIEDKLDSPHCRSMEVEDEIAAKAEVEEMLAGMRGGSLPTDLTSGPVFLGNGGNSIIVTVQNNDASAQTVTIQGQMLLPAQGALPGSPATPNVASGTAAAVVFDIPSGLTVYEIRVHFTVPGSVGVFSAARTQNNTAPLSSSTLLPENTIRYEEFKPQFVIVD